MLKIEPKTGYALGSLLVFIVAAVLLLWIYNPAFRHSILGNTDKTNGKILQIADDDIRIGEAFKVRVGIDTQGQMVNAIGYYVHFDPNVLSVLSLDTKSSFCQFYPEKKFDNINGLISLACGSPHPGFKGENTIMVVEFIPKNVGITTLRVDPVSQLLASDGKGSDLLNESPTLDLKVTAGLE